MTVLESHATARRFVEALAAADAPALLAMMTPNVEFRALTPGRFWEASTPDDAISKVLFVWFPPDDVVEEIEVLEPGDVLGRPKVDYRLRWHNAKGNRYSIEQRAYMDLDDAGLIWRLEIVCGGFRRITD